MLRSKILIFLILLGFALFCFGSSAYAASVPQLINYQGKLTNRNGVPINGQRTITFSIWGHKTEPNSAYIKWSETQTVSVIRGIFSVLMGNVTVLPLDIFQPTTDSFKPGEESYLEIAVLKPGGMVVPPDDPNYYTNYDVLSPRSRITSMGYAFHAENANQVKGPLATDNYLPSSGNVGIGTTEPTHTLDVRGPIRNTHTSSSYDIWIQGGSAASGDDRNLALLGSDEDSGDKLYLNFAGEYAEGTIIGGNVGIGKNPGSGIKLDVNGTVKATSFSGGGLGVQSCSNIWHAAGSPTYSCTYYCEAVGSLCTSCYVIDGGVKVPFGCDVSTNYERYGRCCK